MTNMEPWAKDWLEVQRNKGVKCLEIKQRGEKHYVYHSTTHWDREQRKAIKTSKYLGRLDSVNGKAKIPNYGNEISPGLLKTFPFCGSG